MLHASRAYLLVRTDCAARACNSYAMHEVILQWRSCLLETMRSLSVLVVVLCLVERLKMLKLLLYIFVVRIEISDFSFYRHELPFVSASLALRNRLECHIRRKPQLDILLEVILSEISGTRCLIEQTLVYKMSG